MKTKFTLLLAFVITFITGYAQQPPNGGFENFSNSYTPVGWTSVEDVAGSALPILQSIFTFQDTTTFTQGAASIKLVTDTIPVYSQLLGLGTIPAVISLGTGALDANNNPSFTGIPFTYRPDSLIFDYKLTSPGIDTGGFKLLLSKNASPVFSHADYLFLDSNWVHMALSLTGYYTNNDIPDTLLIQFVSSASDSAIIGTTLHIDNVRFGYITPPIPANVTASGPVSFCIGGTDTLSANTGNGYTYQWSKNGMAVSGATNSFYVVNAAGYYTVQIDSGSSIAYSVPTSIVINMPAVTLPGLNDTVCSNTGTITLQGQPTGGTYAGNGVTGSAFNPGSVSLGIDTIQYTATDANSCTGTATAIVLVESCAGINTITANSFSIYPNPVSGILNINANTDLSGFNLEMFDVLGKRVVSQVLTGANNAIDLTKLTNGTYIYRVTDKENNIVSQSKFSVIK